MVRPINHLICTVDELEPNTGAYPFAREFKELRWRDLNLFGFTAYRARRDPIKPEIANNGVFEDVS